MIVRVQIQTFNICIKPESNTDLWYVYRRDIHLTYLTWFISGFEIVEEKNKIGCKVTNISRPVRLADFWLKLAEKMLFWLNYCERKNTVPVKKKNRISQIWSNPNRTYIWSGACGSIASGWSGRTQPNPPWVCLRPCGACVYGTVRSPRLVLVDLIKNVLVFSLNQSSRSWFCLEWTNDLLSGQCWLGLKPSFSLVMKMERIFLNLTINF